MLWIFQEIVFDLNFAQNLNLLIFLAYLIDFLLTYPLKFKASRTCNKHTFSQCFTNVLYSKKKYIPIMNLVSDQQIDLKFDMLQALL